MKNVPKKHHFVSQFYLAGFTPSGRQDDYLHEHDLTADKPARRVQPKGTGFENHLYTLDNPKLAPDSVEQFFAKIEGYTKPILDFVHKVQCLPPPNSPEFQMLMVFIGLMIVRVPSFRNHVFSKYEAHFKKKMVDGLLSREEFEKSLKGTEIEALAVHYEDLKEFCERDEFDIRFKADLFVKWLFTLFKDFFPFLEKRSWKLWISDPKKATLITTDQPVSLFGVDPSRNPSKRVIDSPGTVVLMALSQQMAVEGRFERLDPVGAADPFMVATLNGCLGANARRFVYSRDPDFSWAKVGGRAIIQNRDQMIQEWRRILKV